MAMSRTDVGFQFYAPDKRAILPIHPPHIPRSLIRFIRKMSWKVCFDQDFKAVIEQCAAPTPDRPDSWINKDIIRLYLALHKMGFAHSVEIWDKDDLIGGLYGVHIGSVFFGESMFSRRSNASKAALAHLMARLYYAGFSILDAQFMNDHLTQFNITEIDRIVFEKQLAQAIKNHIPFPVQIDESIVFDHLAQAKTLTS